MYFSQPITELTRQRYSCRNYAKTPVEAEKVNAIRDFLDGMPPGPFPGQARYQLVYATPEDRNALRGLGTYGFIQDAPAFLIGADTPGEKSLENFGYQMESFILFATGLGLGTCWMGGSFTRGTFARKIQARPGETIPAVVALGYPADDSRAMDDARRQRIAADRRYPWERLFFDGSFDRPLSEAEAGAYAGPLEMVRLAPSASNKQPWRIVRDGPAWQPVWHFYMQRTPGYRDMLIVRFLGVEDMQRIDLGIAMCHFELAAQEAGLRGRWELCEPGISKPDGLTEYVVSWVA